MTFARSPVFFFIVIFIHLINAKLFLDSVQVFLNFYYIEKIYNKGSTDKRLIRLIMLKFIYYSTGEPVYRNDFNFKIYISLMIMCFQSINCKCCTMESYQLHVYQMFVDFVGGVQNQEFQITKTVIKEYMQIFANPRNLIPVRTNESNYKYTLSY